MLQKSGVSIEDVDEARSSITGTIGPRKEPYSCRISVHVFRHRLVSLVEMVCESSWRGADPQTLSAYLETIQSNLEQAMPVDVIALIERQDVPAGQPASKRHHQPG